MTHLRVFIGIIAFVVGLASAATTLAEKPPSSENAKNRGAASAADSQSAGDADSAEASGDSAEPGSPDRKAVDVDLMASAMVEAEIELSTLMESITDEKARQAVDRALRVSRRARDRAVTALTDTAVPSDEVAGDGRLATRSEARAGNTAMDQQSFTEARAAIKSADRQRDRELKRALKTADAETREAIKQARQHIRSTTRVALSTLDRISIERPERLGVSTRATTDVGVSIDRP